MNWSEKQTLSYAQATKRYNIWCGSVSAGKTFSCNHKFVERLKYGPAGDVMILGVSRPTIQRNVLNDIYKILGFPPPGTKTTEDKIYGHNVYFVGAPDESAMRVIQGSTLALAYADEAACLPQPVWKMLESRLRVPGAQLLATCNPEGPVHWLKKDYIDRQGDLDLISWNFTLDDNPSLDPAYKEAIKKSYTGMWYKRYIMGEWAAAHGLVYDSFDHLNIYQDPYPAPITYVVGLDYGTTNATAGVLCAIDTRKWPQIRVEEEYYYDSAKAGRAKTDAELAEDIRRWLQYKQISAIYVDPAAASFKLALRHIDLPVVDANNDVLLGIKITSKFVAQKNLVIHQSCSNLLEQMQSYAWDQKAADRGEDKPVKVQDHGVDSLRYALASTFPTGELSHVDDAITVEQIKKQMYADQSPFTTFMGGNTGGYY